MNLKPINLINTFPKLTPMEENRSNLEVSITMMMITGQIMQEQNPEMADALIIAAAALHNAAEA